LVPISCFCRNIYSIQWTFLFFIDSALVSTDAIRREKHFH